MVLRFWNVVSCSFFVVVIVGRSYFFGMVEYWNEDINVSNIFVLIYCIGF